MNKTKIAIVTKKMVIGGTEKALLPMLKHFDPENCEIDLYLQEFGGELFEELPAYVKPVLMPKYKDDSYLSILAHPIHYIDGIVKRFGMRKEEEYYQQCERACHCMPIVDKKYDVAIAYHAPDAVPFFYTIHNLRADKKIMWLHFDIELTNAVNKLAKKYFSCYQKIFAVSMNAKAKFDFNYPELADRCSVFYNFVDKEDIQQKAFVGPAFTDHFKGTRILSIGRITDQKGYDRLPQIVRLLLDDGYQIKMYICGDGNARERLEQEIDKYGVQKNFVLLGMQSNPYGYLKDCDLYIQPSRNEGFCTTTNEARIFCKPVVVTDVCGMREQFEDHVTGTITEESIPALYQGIKELLDSPNLCAQYKKNLGELLLDRPIDVSILLE